MTGDYTEVPLRSTDRWTGARMQQGRVLRDPDWNLNLDAAARLARGVASDVIGPAGVVAGSPDFRVDVTSGGTLNVHAGRMWVDGLMAHAPESFDYSSQDQIEALPKKGRVLVYLDAFEQHVQPAEAPDALVDPALAPVDSTARTRVGYRVRCAPTTADTCQRAWDGLTRVPGSTGALSIRRAAPAAPADPCAPPGDPLGQLPDGLFRVEVIDAGDAGDARFAWSFENGSGAVGVSQIAGDKVTLRPSAAVTFATGEHVEVSWLARREDRVPHGPLYTITQPGNTLTLDRAVTAPATADGLVVRRWDGQTVGAQAVVSATLRGTDLGVRFKAGAGDYVVGDAWGARVREEEGVGIELRVDAPPDGVRHVFAPLALVDLDAHQVLHDCRPTFHPLTAIKPDHGSCTVSARPGDDLQAAVDSLPASGGELCLAAGLYLLPAPLRITARERIVVSGAGPATVLRAMQTEAALLVQNSSQIEIRHVRIDGGDPGKGGDLQLNGALTVVSSSEVSVSDCSFLCPESLSGGAQSCITARLGGGREPGRIRIERNRLRVGAGETGILLVDVDSAMVAGNEISLPSDPEGKGVRADGELLARGLRSLIDAAIRPEAEAGTKTVQVPGAEPLHVLTDSKAEKLIIALAAGLTASQVRRRGAVQALHAAARRATAGPALAKLPKSAQAVIGQIVEDLRVVSQGIAVGARAGTVHILDNLIEGTAQGIQVGVSGPEGEVREQVDTVIIARNVVRCLVPAFYEGDIHAVFVGNARSIHVVDTVATLEEPGGGSHTPQLVPLPDRMVDGIRIDGELGPFLTVRQSSLSKFKVGVRVQPAEVPQHRMWLVAETMAVGATKTVDAPPDSVELVRNFP